MGQTVNLLSTTSVVRIHLPPPGLRYLVRDAAIFLYPKCMGIVILLSLLQHIMDAPPYDMENFVTIILVYKLLLTKNLVCIPENSTAILVCQAILSRILLKRLTRPKNTDMI